MGRTWPTRVLCAAGLLLPSCGGGTGSPTEPLDLTFPDATCDRIAPAGYVLGTTAVFAATQLIELSYPSATYVAVLQVGESTQMEVKAATIGHDDCSNLITAVTWATSDSQVATTQANGRTTALFTALTPGEVTVQAQASFGSVAIQVPYMFASAGGSIRSIRVLP